MSYLNKSKIQYLTNVVITIILLAIVITPYALVFDPPVLGNESWKKMYIYDDCTLTVMYLPYIILSILSLWKSHWRILRIAVVVVSSLYFLNMSSLLLFPNQDLILETGAYLILLSICILYLVFFLRRKETK